MTNRELEVLMRMRLFAGFTQTELETLLAELRPKVTAFSRGAVIWGMGERVEQAGVVLSGRVEAWAYSADGQGSLVAVHAAGGLFGDVLMSARSVESPVELRVAADSRVLFLPLEVLLNKCAGGGDFGCVRLLSNLLGEISEKYWALQRRVRWLEIPDGRTRVSAWLLYTARQSGGQTLKLSFTREQLARRLGMNRCALSRLLGAMQRDGWIVCRRGEIEICDEPALSKLAENA